MTTASRGEQRGVMTIVSVALLAVVVDFAVLVLLRRLLGWLLPDGAGRLTLIRSAAHGNPGFELMANLIPALFAGAVGILMANRLTMPYERPPLPLAMAAASIAGLLTVVLLATDAAVNAGPALGILALGFGTIIGLLLPAIR